jgi:hypothetical protein
VAKNGQLVFFRETTFFFAQKTDFSPPHTRIITQFLHFFSPFQNIFFSAKLLKTNIIPKKIKKFWFWVLFFQK